MASHRTPLPIRRIHDTTQPTTLRPHHNRTHNQHITPFVGRSPLPERCSPGGHPCLRCLSESQMNPCCNREHKTLTSPQSSRPSANNAKAQPKSPPLRGTPPTDHPSTRTRTTTQTTHRDSIPLRRGRDHIHRLGRRHAGSRRSFRDVVDEPACRAQTWQTSRRLVVAAAGIKPSGAANPGEESAAG